MERSRSSPLFVLIRREFCNPWGPAKTKREREREGFEKARGNGRGASFASALKQRRNGTTAKLNTGRGIHGRKGYPCKTRPYGSGEGGGSLAKRVQVEE